MITEEEAGDAQAFAGISGLKRLEPQRLVDSCIPHEILDANP